MVFEINVKNKRTGMNCLIYKTSTLYNLMITLENLSYLDRSKYCIKIKSEEEN